MACGVRCMVSRFLWNMPEDSILTCNIRFLKDIIYGGAWLQSLLAKYCGNKCIAFNIILNFKVFLHGEEWLFFLNLILLLLP